MARCVWLIAGPTASGKSALALKLAEATGGEIVNADSMQLYADLRILTARPSDAEMTRAPHHLYGAADAADPWSTGRWLRAAETVLAEIAGRGRTAIVVGGTGLYFRALLEGLAEVPDIPMDARAGASALWDQDGEAAVREALRAGDPRAERRIAAGDRQRLLRALGVLRHTGVALSDWQDRTPRPSLSEGGACQRVAIEPDRAALYGRCDARLAAMTDAALAEVAALKARRLDPQLPSMKAVGVAAFARHLNGEITLAAALAEAQQATRNYAKRQLTWLRNQTPDWPRIAALDPADAWAQLTALPAFAA